MYRLLPRIGATNFTITTFIAPLSAIILGVSLLHEVIQPIHLFGMAVIFIGLVVMDGRVVKRLRRVAA
ncbi:MAG: family transporter [Hyphomicrobiales bacterium]|nr:family transporter [Hyphomicrobiales bacterium]